MVLAANIFINKKKQKKNRIVHLTNGKRKKKKLASFTHQFLEERCFWRIFGPVFSTMKAKGTFAVKLLEGQRNSLKSS